MWNAVDDARRASAAARCASSAEVRAHPTATARAIRGVVASRATAREETHRRHRLHLQHAAHRARREARPAGAAPRCCEAAAQLTLPRLPHRLPDRRRGPTSSPTTGSTSTTRTCSVGRIQNFKNWSPDMVPDADQDEPRPRVLLQRGRRALDDARRRADRARDSAELRAHRPGARRATSRTAASSACPRRTRSTTPSYREHLAVVRAYVDGARELSRPSAATACTATTTRTTRC